MSSFIKTSVNKNNHSLRSPLNLVLLSFQLYKTHFWLLAGYACWLLLPVTGYFVLAFFPESNLIVVTFNSVLHLIEFFLTFWIGVILVILINAIVEKQTLDLATLKQKSLSFLQPVAHALVIAFVIIFLGTILLIIPGIIAFIWYAFTQISVILEDKRGAEALKFSKALSSGRFFRVFYRVCMGPILIGLLYSIIISLILSFSGAISGFDPISVASAEHVPPWLNLFQSIIEIFGIPWLATYMILLYIDLKQNGGQGREGGKGE